MKKSIYAAAVRPLLRVSSRSSILRRAVLWAAPLALSLLAACSADVTRSADPVLAKPQFANHQTQAGNLEVTLTPEAQQKLADNLKFDQDKLLDTVRRALVANNVLTKDVDPSRAKVEIKVTDMRVRSNFSAIMFGFMAGDDHIDGDVIVISSTGSELQEFKVAASYALGGLAGGQDSARMDWLYENFAKRVVEELTGTGDRTNTAAK